MSSEPQLLHPRRSAHASIRGYLYQACLGAQRWLELEEGQALLCEGDEDLDRLLRGGERILEQVKLRSAEVAEALVLESLRNFLTAFHALSQSEDSAPSFVFLTNAPASRKLRQEGLLALWNQPGRRSDLIAELRGKLPTSKKGGEAVSEALGWLEVEGRWDGFLDVVELTFEAPEIPAVRRTLSDLLAARSDARPLLPDQTETLVDRLVLAVIDTSSRPQPGDRLLRPGDLDELLRSMAEPLLRWAATVPARALRRSFDEVAELEQLLEKGTRELPLPGAPRRLPPGKLLTAAYEVVPFTAREAELAEIANWCDSQEARKSVWLWTGDGGTGKTRLLIEACNRQRHAGWVAGFLPPDAASDGLARLLEGHLPRLVVVDYAETRLTQQVRPLVQRLARRPAEGPQVRLLLLARRGGDWWNVLAKEDPGVEDLLLAAPPPHELEPLLSAPAERRSAFKVAAAGFARARGGTPPAEEPILDLSGPLFERTLYFHIAALLTIEGEATTSDAGLLAAILDHERRFWWREAEDQRNLSEPQAEALKEAMEQAMAAVTLIGGTPADSTRELLTTIAGRELSTELCSTLLRLLDRLYGRDGRCLEGLQPDLLGEQLVAEVLARDEDLLLRTLDAADKNGRAQALAVLTRLAKYRPPALTWLERALRERLEELAETALEVAIESGDPLGPTLARRVAATAGLSLAERLMAQCDGAYQHIVHLREVALEATRKAVDLYREAHPEPEEAELVELARRVNNLGNRFSALDCREDALDAAQKAVGLYRLLAKTRPDAFRPNLATSLSNLGIKFGALGRHEDALEAAQEAVDLHRLLAKTRPEAFRPDLARSLSNLGPMLRNLGRHEDAFDAAQKAVGLYRLLAETRPDAFRPNLALSLDNLGPILRDLDRHEDAFDAAQEAVDLYRLLAETRPDVFRSDLARSLSNLGPILSALDCHQDALKATQEAVGLYRLLAETRPDVFRSDLARSLNNLGLMLRELGRHKAALDAAQKAVHLCRLLTKTRPHAYPPHLAMSLTNLGLILRNLDRHEAALDVTQEAVNLYRLLAETRPDAFRPDLARSLNNLGAVLRGLERHDDALDATQEAVRTLAPFFLGLPTAFASLMDLIVRNYLECAKVAAQEPDSELLEPIAGAFRALQIEDPPDDTPA